SAFATLFVANTDHIVDLGKEDLSIANLAGACRPHDGLDRFFHELIRQHQLQLGLGDEVYRIFLAAIKLGVAFLPPVPANFQHRHAFDANLVESVFHGVQFGCANDRFNLCHDVSIFSSSPPATSDDSGRNFPIVTFLAVL